MAEGDIVFYNNFKEQLLKKQIDFVNDAFTLTLHTGYTPNIDTHAAWADVSATEYGTASGYTAGGKTFASKTVAQDDTDDEGVFDAADVTWTSLGALSPATPSHAIVLDTTTDMLVGYIVLGTTATNGGDYTVAWNAEGIINTA